MKTYDGCRLENGTISANKTEPDFNVDYEVMGQLGSPLRDTRRMGVPLSSFRALKPDGFTDVQK
jgi:hypothetical protein